MGLSVGLNTQHLGEHVRNDVNKTCVETNVSKQQNRKLPDNEQIQLMMGQCNEMFIA